MMLRTVRSFLVLALLALAADAQTTGCIYSWQPGTIVARTTFLLPGGIPRSTLTLLASGQGSDPATCETEPGDCKVITCSDEEPKKSNVSCEDLVIPSCVREQIIQCSPDFIPWIRKIIVDSAGSACP